MDKKYFYFKEGKKELIVVLILMSTFLNLGAQDIYTVTWINTKVRIGNTLVSKVGDKFDNEKKKTWPNTNARQRIIAVRNKDNKEYAITIKGTQPYTKQAPNRTQIKRLEHKGGDYDLHYGKDTLFLIDSIYVQVPENYQSNRLGCKPEAVWKDGTDEIVSTLEKTNDGKFYIVTPKVFGDNEPRDIRLFIRERNDDGFIYNVYSYGIPILFFPSKL